MCGTLTKKGAGSCASRYLNSRKLEGLVVDKIREEILTPDNLTKLARLVAEEMNANLKSHRAELDTIEGELAEVARRLERLYDAVETVRIPLDDLAPRIKELKTRQDELLKMRVQIEADMVVQGVNHVDAENIKSYALDLHSLLGGADFTRSKAFLRSFIKRITID